MTNAQGERPRFYQGQYIGPEDLAAVVDHGRWAMARHDLGAHAWGIAVGLELRAIDALGGGVEVYVEPGYAVDGFGRPLAVTSALPVPIDQLGDLAVPLAPGETSARLPVWLRYAESDTAEPPDGFGTCADDRAFARVVERCEVIVGARSLASQRDPVMIAGERTNPSEALRTIDTDAPLLCDASIPFQEFPEGDDRWWLVPLGFVRWEPGSPGRLVETTEADRRASRRARRYLAVVTEGVLGAAGLIRLRARERVPDVASSTGDPCEEEWPRVAGTTDLRYDATSGRVTPAELVWVEGHLRVAGDARLFGGEVEWRDAGGDTHGVPMRARRVETNSFLDAADQPLSGRDVELLIGTTGEDGRNRLVIGANPADPGSIGGKVVVQNDGRVGIGTLDPPTHLLSPLTIRAVGGGEELLTFETAAAARKWHVSQKPGGSDGLGFVEASAGVNAPRLFLAAGGQVGMSTRTPGAKLDIASVPAAAGSLWLRVGDGGDSGRFWVEYGSTLAPLMVLSDKDDPPRLRFQQLGTSTDERAPQYASWIGHARPGSPDLAAMNGRLGVGTTEPQAPLHVAGGSDVVLGTAASGYLLLGDTGTYNIAVDDNELMARNNGAPSMLYLQAEGGGLSIHDHLGDASRVVVTATGRVGLGTATPAERLDVRGNVKLGAAGEFFGVGALENLRMVSGQVSSAGAVVRGVGFTSTRTGEGTYRVNFDTAFTAPPIILVTLVDAIAEDNTATLEQVAAASFRVVTMDVEGGDGLQDTAFTFIAFGLRP